VNCGWASAAMRAMLTAQSSSGALDASVTCDGTIFMSVTMPRHANRRGKKPESGNNGPSGVFALAVPRSSLEIVHHEGMIWR